jgi:hypothetical protein
MRLFSYINTLGIGRTEKLKRICFMKSNELFGDFTVKALTNIIFNQETLGIGRT